LLAHGRWFSPASSTTKTGRHDIAEILLKVTLKHQQQKKHIDNHDLSSSFMVDVTIMMNILPFNLYNSDIIVITLYESINLNFYT
jgi:hypothetical protein